MEYDELFQKEAFQALEPEKKELLKNIYSQLQGKQPAEMLQILMRNAAVFQKGKKISKEEQQLMFETLRASLPEGERKNADKLLGILQSFPR